MQTAHGEDSIITRLLNATKVLESSFVGWSQGKATESQVSDCYVQLGNAYMEARSVLVRANIKCDDLIDVPKQLRQILEEALAKPPSNDIILVYGDQLRSVMAQLFRQLKEKQSVRTHSRQKSANSNLMSPPAVQVSQPFNQQYSQQYNQPPTSPYAAGHSRKQGQIKHASQQPMNPGNYMPNYMPPYAQNTAYITEATPNSPTHQPRHKHTQRRTSPRHADQTSGISEPVQYARKRPPVNANSQQLLAPPENDVLYKLQHHGALERQASKRYSTQQLSKIVNGSPTPSIYIPTTVINRRSGVPDFRDTNVVVRRTAHESSQSDTSKSSDSRRRQKVHSDYEQTSSDTQVPEPVKTVKEKPVETPLPKETVEPVDTVASTAAPAAPAAASTAPAAATAPAAPPAPPLPSTAPVVPPAPPLPSTSATPPPSTPLNSEPTTAQGSEFSDSVSSPNRDVDLYDIEPVEETMPVFLRIGGMVRKAIVSKSPTMAALRLSFVEVCEYVHSESGTFPAIEILDSKLGIEYELTESTVCDIKEGQLLTLKVRSPEVLAVDDELKQIKEQVKHLVDKLDGKFSSTIPSTPNPARSIHSPMLSTPNSLNSSLSHTNSFMQSKKLIDLPKDKAELVKRELAVIRQTTNKAMSQMNQEVTKLRNELKYLSDAPPVGDRGFIVQAKSKIDMDVKTLVSKIDDLSDVIDAQRISVGSRGVSGSIHIHDAQTGQLVRTLDGRKLRVGSLSWGNNVLSSGAQDNSIWHHDMRQKEHLLGVSDMHKGEVCGLTWRSDGRYLASGGNDNLVALWDSRQMSRPAYQLVQHEAAVKALAWCPWQTNALATGGGTADRRIHLWNTNSGEIKHTIEANAQVSALHWNSNTNEIVASLAYPTNSIGIWNHHNVKKVAEIEKAHDERILNSSISPDDSMLVTCGADENIKFWRLNEKSRSRHDHSLMNGMEFTRL